jgi:hypothetical protein
MGCSRASVPALRYEQPLVALLHMSHLGSGQSRPRLRSKVDVHPSRAATSATPTTHSAVQEGLLYASSGEFAVGWPSAPIGWFSMFFATAHRIIGYPDAPPRKHFAKRMHDTANLTAQVVLLVDPRRTDQEPHKTIKRRCAKIRWIRYRLKHPQERRLMHYVLAPFGQHLLLVLLAPLSGVKRVIAQFTSNPCCFRSCDRGSSFRCGR